MNFKQFIVGLAVGKFDIDSKGNLSDCKSQTEDFAEGFLISANVG